MCDHVRACMMEHSSVFCRCIHLVGRLHLDSVGIAFLLTWEDI